MGSERDGVVCVCCPASHKKEPQLSTDSALMKKLTMLSGTSVVPNLMTGSFEQTGTLGSLKDASMGVARMGVKCVMSTAQTMMREGEAPAWGPGCSGTVEVSSEGRMDPNR